MKFRAAKWLVMSLVTVSAFAIASASAEAEACCGLWQCLFGWCGGCRPSCCSPCGPSMGGCGPGNCGPGGCPTSTYYGPVVYGGCAPCASTCSPCGVASAGCATGDCAVRTYSNDMPPAPKPEPNDNWNPKKKGNAGSQGNTSDGDMGARDDSKFKKARTNEETDPGDQQGSTTPAKSEGNTSKASKKGPAAPKASDGDAPDSSGAPATISVDEKVAWRTAPARTRAESRTRTVSARIVRVPAYPKSDWLPVEGESKVAQK